MSETKKVYLVWNEARNECVGFLDRYDAEWTSTGGDPALGGYPTIGEAFRECYAEDIEALPVTVHEIHVSDDRRGV